MEPNNELPAVICSASEKNYNNIHYWVIEHFYHPIIDIFFFFINSISITFISKKSVQGSTANIFYIICNL